MLSGSLLFLSPAAVAEERQWASILCNFERAMSSGGIGHWVEEGTLAVGYGHPSFKSESSRDFAGVRATVSISDYLEYHRLELRLADTKTGQAAISTGVAEAIRQFPRSSPSVILERGKVGGACGVRLICWIAPSG